MNKVLFKKKFSVKSMIITQFILIFIAMMALFISSYTVKKQMILHYERTMDNAIKLGNLTTEINRSINYFDQYLLNPKDSKKQDYLVSRNKIYDILESADSMELDTEGRIYLRNLRNMYDYHIVLSNEILLNNLFNIDTYKKMVEMRTLFLYMDKHSQSLNTSYLNSTGVEYLKTLERTRAVEAQIYTMFSLLAIILLTIIVKILKGLLSTMNILTQSAKELSTGNWDIDDIALSRYSEINTMADAFNKMKHNIKNFIEELKYKSVLEARLNKEKLRNVEQQHLLKETKLQALQAQINPHFLFNSLNTLSRMAMFESADETAKLIQSISRIMRYNLSHLGELVSLREEIAALKAYSTIQQIRFQDYLTINFDIGVENKDIFIPQMIIQPIVENAIKHGISNTSYHGCISIVIIEGDKHLVISVKDNGAGMSANEIENVLIGNVKTNTDSTGIGLENIRKRLQLRYSRKDLIKIISSEGRGTEITLRIPFSKEDANAKAYDS